MDTSNGSANNTVCIIMVLYFLSDDDYTHGHFHRIPRYTHSHNTIHTHIQYTHSRIHFLTHSIHTHTKQTGIDTWTHIRTYLSTPMRILFIPMLIRTYIWLHSLSYTSNIAMITSILIHIWKFWYSCKWCAIIAIPVYVLVRIWLSNCCEIRAHQCQYRICWLDVHCLIGIDTTSIYIYVSIYISKLIFLLEITEIT